MAVKPQTGSAAEHPDRNHPARVQSSSGGPGNGSLPIKSRNQSNISQANDRKPLTLTPLAVKPINRLGSQKSSRVGSKYFETQKKINDENLKALQRL